jgi:hypothetical protein
MLSRCRHLAFRNIPSPKSFTVVVRPTISFQAYQISITPSRRHLRGRHLVSQPAAALTPATTAVQSRIENITGRGVKKCELRFSSFHYSRSMYFTKVLPRLTQTVWLPIENSTYIQIDAVM